MQESLEGEICLYNPVMNLRRQGIGIARVSYLHRIARLLSHGGTPSDL